MSAKPSRNALEIRCHGGDLKRQALGEEPGRKDKNPNARDRSHGVLSPAMKVLTPIPESDIYVPLPDIDRQFAWPYENDTASWVQLLIIPPQSFASLPVGALEFSG